MGLFCRCVTTLCCFAVLTIVPYYELSLFWIPRGTRLGQSLTPPCPSLRLALMVSVCVALVRGQGANSHRRPLSLRERGLGLA